jgi:hypothetical protein
MATTGLFNFLAGLFEDGRVKVGAELAIAPAELTDAAAFLERQEQAYRRQLPHSLPRYDPAVGLQGAILVYRAAQLLIHREFPKEALDGLLPLPEPNATVDCHYSIDLCLRFLPDLYRMAKAAAPQDQLVERLRDIGGVWPLSSVGMGGEITVVDAGVLRTSAALWREYVDRIIQRQDLSRMQDPHVVESVKAVAGSHPRLVGKLLSELGTPTV